MATYRMNGKSECQLSTASQHDGYGETTVNKDKYIVERLGLEPKLCNGCRITMEDALTSPNAVCNHEKSRPDFAAPAGTVKLLELMESHKDGKLFFAKLMYRGPRVEAIDDDGLIARNYITAPGKLRDAVYDWLKGRE